MVQEARTVTATTTRLLEYHSIQKKDKHVAESAGTNCIDRKLPGRVTSALRIVATDREAGLRQFGGCGRLVQWW